MCGIVGIVAHSPVNQAIYDGLTVLQHRGQDAAGIITCDGGRLHLRKDNGPDAGTRRQLGECLFDLECQLACWR